MSDIIITDDFGYTISLDNSFNVNWIHSKANENNRERIQYLTHYEKTIICSCRDGTIKFIDDNTGKITFKSDYLYMDSILNIKCDENYIYCASFSGIVRKYNCNLEQIWQEHVNSQGVDALCITNDFLICNNGQNSLSLYDKKLGIKIIDFTTKEKINSIMINNDIIYCVGNNGYVLTTNINFIFHYYKEYYLDNNDWFYITKDNNNNILLCSTDKIEKFDNNFKYILTINKPFDYVDYRENFFTIDTTINNDIVVGSYDENIKVFNYYGELKQLVPLEKTYQPNWRTIIKDNYIITGTRDGCIFKVDLDGNVLWDNIGKIERIRFSVNDGNNIYCAYGNHYLQILTKNGHNKEFKFLHYDGLLSLDVNNNFIVTTGGDGCTHILEKNDLKIAKTYKNLVKNESKKVIFDKNNNIIIGSFDELIIYDFINDNILKHKSIKRNDNTITNKLGTDIRGIDCDDNNNICYASTNGCIVMLSKDNYVPLWKFSHNYKLYKVKIIDEYVYSGDVRGNILKLSCDNGELIWEKNIHDETISDIKNYNNDNILSVAEDNLLKIVNKHNGDHKKIYKSRTCITSINIM